MDLEWAGEAREAEAAVNQPCESCRRFNGLSAGKLLELLDIYQPGNCAMDSVEALGSDPNGTYFDDVNRSHDNGWFGIDKQPSQMIDFGLTPIANAHTPVRLPAPHEEPRLYVDAAAAAATAAATASSFQQPMCLPFINPDVSTDTPVSVTERLNNSGQSGTNSNDGGGGGRSRPFRCIFSHLGYCDANGFGTENDAERHEHASHFKTMSWHCPMCPLVVYRKDNFLKHLQTHYNNLSKEDAAAKEAEALQWTARWLPRMCCPHSGCKEMIGTDNVPGPDDDGGINKSQASAARAKQLLDSFLRHFREHMVVDPGATPDPSRMEKLFSWFVNEGLLQAQDDGRAMLQAARTQRLGTRDSGRSSRSSRSGGRICHGRIQRRGRDYGVSNSSHLSQRNRKHSWHGQIRKEDVLF